MHLVLVLVLVQKLLRFEEEQSQAMPKTPTGHTIVTEGAPLAESRVAPTQGLDAFDVFDLFSLTGCFFVSDN